MHINAGKGCSCVGREFSCRWKIAIEFFQYVVKMVSLLIAKPLVNTPQLVAATTGIYFPVYVIFLSEIFDPQELAPGRFIFPQ